MLHLITLILLVSSSILTYARPTLISVTNQLIVLTMYEKANCKGAKHAYKDIHLDDTIHSKIHKASSYKLDRDLSSDVTTEFGTDNPTKTFSSLKAGGPGTTKGCFNFPGEKPDWFVMHTEVKRPCSLWQETPYRARRAIDGCLDSIYA